MFLSFVQNIFVIFVWLKGLLLLKFYRNYDLNVRIESLCHVLWMSVTFCNSVYFPNPKSWIFRLNLKILSRLLIDFTIFNFQKSWQINLSCTSKQLKILAKRWQNNEYRKSDKIRNFKALNYKKRNFSTLSNYYG